MIRITFETDEEERKLIELHDNGTLAMLFGRFGYDVTRTTGGAGFGVRIVDDSE